MIHVLYELKLRAAMHTSTLTGVYNVDALDLLASLNASRIILFSDLFVDKIAELIEQRPNIEYEIIADGGDCFNSNRSVYYDMSVPWRIPVYIVRKIIKSEGMTLCLGMVSESAIVLQSYTEPWGFTSS